MSEEHCRACGHHCFQALCGVCELAQLRADLARVTCDRGDTLLRAERAEAERDEARQLLTGRTVSCVCGGEALAAERACVDRLRADLERANARVEDYQRALASRSEAVASASKLHEDLARVTAERDFAVKSNAIVTDDNAKLREVVEALRALLAALGTPAHLREQCEAARAALAALDGAR